MQGKERWRGIGKPCIASQVHTDAVHGLHIHVRRPRPVLPMHSCPALRGGWPRRRYHALKQRTRLAVIEPNAQLQAGVV